MEKTQRKASISSSLCQHPELSIRKEKIFTKVDSKAKKTKVVCTLG